MEEVYKEEQQVEQQQEVVDKPEEDIVLPEVEKQTPVIAKKSNNEEMNFSRLREAKEKAERERAELEKRLSAYEQKEEEVKNSPDYGDDDFVEGKHLKSELKSIRKELNSYKKQQVEQTDEVRLKAKYSDFETIVNPDNIAKLKELDPETAETIAMSQASLFIRGAAAYKRLKELGVGREKEYEKDIKHTQTNASKPRASNSISPQQGDSPLSMANAFANGLTTDIKQQLWKEMQEAVKRH